MPTLTITIGAPGSGKTTLSKEIAATHNIKRISMDENGYLQHSELHEPIITALQSGESVIADAVYGARVWREELLHAIHAIPCRKIAIFVDTPKDECVRRNAGRANPLPSFMVESIHDSIEPPTFAEGWDEIHTVK